MKVAVLIFDGGKQIMFTPENDMEREALSLITPNDDIHTVVCNGSFSDTKDVLGFDIYKCNGGYYRAEVNQDSVMFVVTPKKKVKTPADVDGNGMSAEVIKNAQKITYGDGVALQSASHPEGVAEKLDQPISKEFYEKNFEK